MKKFQITSGADKSKGVKTVLYGVEGIGKTTLASKFPNPVFIDTEGGTGHFDNIQRLPRPKDWQELNEMVDFISQEKPCNTLVIDTFDWAEMAEMEALLKEKGWRSITSPGYGEGYVQSAERITRFLNDIETKLINKGINVVLNCHSKVTTFELPEESGQYQKYELKLGKQTGSKTSALVKEWADMVLFCNWLTSTEKVEGKFGNKKTVATGGKKRVMYTTHSAVWDAKNRFGLPEKVDMDWNSIKSIFADRGPQQAKPKPLPSGYKADVEYTEPGNNSMPIEEDKLELVLWPSCVPDKVKQLCEEDGFFPEDIQLMLFRAKITKREDFPLAQVPQNFWTAYARDYKDKWQALTEDAHRDNLPF